MSIHDSMFIEKTLLLQLKQGSTKALEQLHGQFSTKIYNSCRRFYLDHEDAEEVVQDVFLKIWATRENIKMHLSFNAYIFTISKNLILKKLQKKVLKETLDKYVNNTLFSTSTIEEQLIAQDVEKLLDEIISNLPPQKQKIFLLNIYYDKSIEEIANELGLSKRTVESHIYQTRALLKRKINLNALLLPLIVGLFS
jgi:RNA polymerase sigma-70 factor (family 1)